MPPEAEPDAPKEIRIEGGKLAIAVGVALLLLLASFQAGRVVERWSTPVAASSPSDPLAGVEPEAVDSVEKPTFFDTVSGPGKEAEPKREARAATSTAPSAPVPVTPGPWFVQVFVGRDRQAAEDVVRSLRSKQYPVRIDSIAEGGAGRLFKVRVGGFPTKGDADGAADKLHGDGHNATWVVRIGS